jgi:tetratricopeptide (TPR) repeat protein
MGDVRSGYTDFDVVIGPRDGDVHPLELLDSPFGQVRTTMAPPFADAVSDHELSAIRQIVATPGYAVSGGTVERAAQARRYGTALFTALLGGDLRPAYAASRTIAEGNGEFLRIKLRIRAPELAALPWELLYDPVLQTYVLLRDQVSLVRFPETAGPVKRLSVDGPLRILGIIADLPSERALGAQSERSHLEAALAGLRSSELIELQWLVNPSWRELVSIMERGPWHVVHFIGHAGFDVLGGGYVVIASDEPEGVEPVPFELSADDLASTFAETGDVRLIVINACDSSTGRPADGSGATAHRLVEAGLSAAIGMQNVIHDDAAIEFSRQLYEQLARMRPIDRAVAAARSAMDLAVPETLQWAVPTLHMRVASGVVFERPDSAAPTAGLDDLLEEGIACFHDGDLGRASQLIGQAVRLEPDRADLTAWSAVVAASTDPPTPDALTTLALQLAGLDAMIDAEPRSVTLLGLRGMGLVALGRLPEALADLDAAIAAAPNLAGTRVARARCHLAAGSPTQAIADLDVAVRLVPHLATPLVLRAQARGALGDQRAAIDDLSAALAIHPTGPFRLLRSEQFAALGEYGMAASDLDFELERHPTAELFARRGWLRHRQAYHAAGRRDFLPAVEDFTAALALDPRDPDLFAARARSFSDHAAYNEGADDSARRAAEDYRRAIELRPGDGQLHHQLGLALDQAHDRRAAKDAYRAAAKLGVRAARDALPIWRRWGL